MHLYVDGWFVRPPLRGIGNYIINLSGKISKLSNAKVALLCPNRYKALGIEALTSCPIIYIQTANIFAWYERDMPRYIRQAGNCKFFLPSGIVPIFSTVPCFTVSTVHDLSCLDWKSISFGSALPFKLLARIYRILSLFKALRSSHVVLTVSHTTSSEIQRLSSSFSMAQVNPAVVYNSTAIPKDQLPKGVSKQKILLCVSGIDPQKNVVRLLKSLDQIPVGCLRSWTLVVVGLSKELEYRHYSGITVIQKPYTNGNELMALYAEAFALIFPSIHESFGIPIVEAVNSSCWIVASKYGAPREISPKGSIFFDPLSTSSIAEAILQLIHLFPSPPDCLELPLACTQTWDNAASQVLSLFNSSALSDTR